jgi:hypothetical protein
LTKYLKERDEWQAGLNPREKVDSVTLEELFDQFVESKAKKVKSKAIITSGTRELTLALGEREYIDQGSLFAS